MIVVDASAVAPLILPDEAHRLIPGLREVFIEGEVLVPQHWSLEVLNLAIMCLRRGRLSQAGFENGLSALSGFDVIVDEETPTQAWAATKRLAEKHRLTAYDAAYLELAVRTGSGLATFDAELADAADQESVKLLR